MAGADEEVETEGESASFGRFASQPSPGVPPALLVDFPRTDFASRDSHFFLFLPAPLPHSVSG